jgi:hypothetical protein
MFSSGFFMLVSVRHSLSYFGFGHSPLFFVDFGFSDEVLVYSMYLL